ncbi:unnamed protein product [Tetraodon nigroviridis]|uniref:(spotted green pufferfish) hypothetical protein n=1 Tax=Tetraodon nigroviridis TaxID=99883 RepID=Q4RPU1_TETNG|nr:unnamed protein product [Tetraodon nigroviridis]
MLEAPGFALVLLDLVCLVLACIFSSGAQVQSAFPFFILTPRHTPFKRGFFCSDESIRFPLREDTISYQLLGGVMVPSTLVVLVCGECLSVHMSRVANQPPGTRYLTCVYKAVGIYAFGPPSASSLTDVAKYSLGRLRPNFLGGLQTALGGHRLQARELRGELHLQRGPFPGGRGQTFLLLRTRVVCNVLHAVSCPVHPSPADLRVGPAPASHHPVLPGRRRRVRGSVQGVGLQTPLERRAGGAAAGGPGGRFYRAVCVRLLQAARRRGGEAGGRRNTRQFTGKPPQWDQLRQHGMSQPPWPPGAEEDRQGPAAWTSFTFSGETTVFALPEDSASARRSGLDVGNE